MQEIRPRSSSFDSLPPLSYFQKTPLDKTIDKMVKEIQWLSSQSKDELQRGVYIDYNADLSKEGNKKFVARQPETIKGIKEWRHRMKKLLRQYLKLKLTDDKSKIDDINQNSLKEETRFRIKVDGSPMVYNFSKSNKKDFSLTIQNKSFSLSDKEELIFQKGVVTRIFQGSHLEYRNYDHSHKESDSYWNDWKTKKQDVVYRWKWWIDLFPLFIRNIIYNSIEKKSEMTHCWKRYKEIIHPVLIEVALKILNDTTHKCPKVVEICGGEGELAYNIAREYKNPMDYYLLEYNDRSLYAAERLVSNGRRIDKFQGQVTPIKTDVTNREDYFADSKKKHPLENNSIDLVIGSGALTENVLENKEVASKVARKCFELLKPQGKMILAGNKDSLLHKEDFEKLGFKVINMSLPGDSSDYFRPDVNIGMFPLGEWNKQLYILEKPEKSE